MHVKHEGTGHCPDVRAPGDGAMIYADPMSSVEFHKPPLRLAHPVGSPNGWVPGNRATKYHRPIQQCSALIERGRHYLLAGTWMNVYWGALTSRRGA
ncbi:hypothetical protein QF036_000220 [Arthrobacter globiformis]|nr:hypothetical protein [Arthrobacter globiformis]